MPGKNATILIPDISGYTEFLTTTELRHSAHAINQFLTAMINAASEEYVVSDIQGDAVLLVRMGPPPTRKEFLATCLRIYKAFHSQRIWMEQHSICPCSACMEIRHLTLKFVAHRGAIVEVNIGGHLKHSGPDMIAVHRLMKNSVGRNEYLLVTESMWNELEGEYEETAWNWQPGNDDYPSLGRIDYRYSLMEEARNAITVPPDPNQHYANADAYRFSVNIDAPFREVYMVIKNIPDWANWVPGLEKVEQEIPEAFLGSLHRCSFEGVTSLVSPIRIEFHDNHILYAENCRLEEWDVAVIHEFVFNELTENTCRVDYALIPMPGKTMSTDKLEQITENQRRMMDQLKVYCESQAASYF